MIETIISVQQLTKSYGTFRAVDSIDLDIHRGEIYGLLGPNGAGKTTTLECLEGLRLPDTGNIRIMDIDPVDNIRGLHKTIGVQLQSSGLPPSMTVAEAMKFFCLYHGVEPRLDLLDRFGLKEKTDSQYHSLSTGLQRRLALALAIAHQPPVVILDEPTAGLDVPSRLELHQVMDELRSQGITILLATHDMAEAEKMADRVSILLQGQIVVTGKPRELTATGQSLTKITISTANHSLTSPDFNIPTIQNLQSQDDYVVCFCTDIEDTLKAILLHLEQHSDSIIDLRVERPSLEERFLEITKEKKQ